jgi:hypothetical protein
LHDRVLRQRVEQCGVFDFQNGEQNMRFFIQKNRIIVDADTFEQSDKVEPNLVVAKAVFGNFAFVEFHFKSDSMHYLSF